MAPPVGLLIAGLFFKNIGQEHSHSTLVIMLHAMVITTGLWWGCMVIVEKLWDKFPWEHYPVKHIIFEVVLIFAYTNLFSFGLYVLELKLGLIKPAGGLFAGIVITNLITFLITAIHEAVFFYKQWKIHFSKSVKLEKDTIEARYETLKSQINPHFLFNSLNSLVSIVEENAPAVDYIQNLSEFLRYVLKSRDKELVTVRDELSILQKYLSLQKLRFQQNLNIHISVPDNCFDYLLPPLVLQMLVENCIKHNIVSKEKPLYITLKTEKDYLAIENNLQGKIQPASTGNGLSNIVQRYSFFTRREVKIFENSVIFKVSIPLLINET